jgi:CRISPR-associated protein (TIGR03986 family)
MPDFLGAPYNFVPLDEQVYLPDAEEADAHLSGSLDVQDRPFPDGLSGHLEVEATAMTPLFIRGAGVHPKDPAQKLDQAAHHQPYRLPDGRYALPGTSLKGMLRNVVEVAGLARLAQIDDQRRHAFRDLSNSDETFYSGWMSQQLNPGEPGPPEYEAKARAGWLVRDKDGNPAIQPCTYYRVTQEEIIRVYPLLDVVPNRFSARKKYQLHGAKDGVLPVSWKAPIPDLREIWGDGRVEKYFYVELVDALARDKTATPQGRLVLTGQPGPKKTLEFVFTNYDPSRPSFPVPRAEWDDFQANHDHEDGDWKAFWQSKFGRVPIPVFYLAFSEDNPTVASKVQSLDTPNAKLHSFGLALMYRLAARHRVGDARPFAHQNRNAAPESRAELDLAELLFGTVEGKFALRGRVRCEPFPALGSPQPGERISLVLGTPKPTFYPAYLEQPAQPRYPFQLQNNQSYNTMQSPQPRLRGWKRYPVYEDFTDRVPKWMSSPGEQQNIQRIGNGGQGKVASHLRPLPPGTRFAGRITFHNLRPWELGALIWALHWGLPTEQVATSTFRHTLGMAKPFGFGSLHLRVASSSLRPNQGTAPTLDQCREAFEKRMVGFRPNWQTGEAMRELLAMADSGNPAHAAWLRYPNHVVKPGRDGGVGVFGDLKRDRFILPRYSQMQNHNPVPANYEARWGGAVTLLGNPPSAPGLSVPASASLHPPLVARLQRGKDDTWSAKPVHGANGGACGLANPQEIPASAASSALCLVESRPAGNHPPRYQFLRLL